VTCVRSGVEAGVESQKGAVKHFGAVGSLVGRGPFERGMADAAAARDEDHTDGREARNVLCVMPGTARQVHRSEPCFGCSAADSFAERRSGECRCVKIGSRAHDLHVFFFADGLESIQDARSDLIDFGCVEVAELDRELHAPGNHVDGAGLGFDPADSADLPARLAADFFAHSQHRARRCGESISAAIHGSSSRMVGESGSGAGALADADNALHDADGNLGFVEHRALLDVQFEVASERAFGDARFGDARSVATHARKPVAEFFSSIILAGGDVGGEQPGGRG